MNTPAATEWIVGESRRDETQSLARALDIHRIVAHLLLQRGIETEEGARRFLNPGVENLTDPFLLEDMSRAVERIREARVRQERVLVFGDYDVDGIAGTAILTGALRQFGIAHCAYGIPDRIGEGYGLNPERVRCAQSQGVTLIITADNGATAHDAARLARELGIDLIVTDHHQFEGGMPDVFAVINPRRQAADYPGVDACGAAVALKLAWALGCPTDLDLAALGTVADIVPLRGENRDIVAAGLAQFASEPRLGLATLAEVARLQDKRLRAEHIAFQLAPRLNAGGRVGTALTGLRLLMSTDPDEARRLARELDLANEERRAIESAICEEARAMLECDFDPGQRTIVLAKRGWHPGVIGVVASRLQSEFYRPIALIGLDENGRGRGSARSVDGFDISRAIAACKDFLLEFGGHEGAAGLSIAESQIQAFRDAFEAEARELLAGKDLVRRLHIDGQVAFSEIDGKLVRTLEMLEPCGYGNPAPVFCAFGVEPLPHSWRELRGGHLRVTVREGSRVFPAVGFHMASRLPGLSTAHALDVAFTPQLNTYRGETTIQLVIKDLRRASPVS